MQARNEMCFHFHPNRQTVPFSDRLTQFPFKVAVTTTKASGRNAIISFTSLKGSGSVASPAGWTKFLGPFVSL